MTFNESNYKEISELVKNLEIECTGFELSEISYTLITCPSKNYDGSQNGEAAEYGNPEGEWVIYLWDNLDEKIQRPLLFHEIVEIYHVESGMKTISAHNAALQQEKRFCEDYLTKLELESYLQFKKEHGCNGFDLLAE